MQLVVNKPKKYPIYGETRFCKECKKSFTASYRQIRIGYGIFCSRKCACSNRKKSTDMRMLLPVRVCRVCKVEKKREEFSPDYRTHSLVQSMCKSCNRDWARNDRIKNKDKYRHRDWKRNYGITPTQYHGMLIEQNGVCAICKQPETRKNGWLHVDHNHRTMLVRGLLCGNCNTGIGKFGDNISKLESAIQYLKER